VHRLTCIRVHGPARHPTTFHPHRQYLRADPQCCRGNGHAQPLRGSGAQECHRGLALVKGTVQGGVLPMDVQYQLTVGVVVVFMVPCGSAHPPTALS
jgi:hypothetical protein